MRVMVVHNAYQSHQTGGEDVVVKQETASLINLLGKENVFEYRVFNDDINRRRLMINLWGDKAHYANIFALVKKHRIDIVHVHNFFPLLTPTVFAGAKDAGAKVIHTLHNFRWWCHSGILYREGRICEQCVGKQFSWPSVIHGCYRGSKLQSLASAMAFFWYRLKKYANYIDAYFVLSQFQQQKLQSVLGKQKLFLKPNAIDEPINLPSIENKADYLFVGRLESAKGIHLLLSIWTTLPPTFRLKIIGTGTGDSTLRKQFERSNIQFLGSLSHEEVMTHMKKAKYFIHSSLAYETFGLTMLEALSCATPVIGINRGPRTEIIQSGKNGFLGEPHELKDLIIQAFNYADYESLSKQAFESAKPFYMANIIIKQVAFYQKVLQKEGFT